MGSALPSSLDEFYQSVLGISIHGLKFNSYQDNFDASRFNTDEKDHSQDFDLNSKIFYFTWFFFNRENLFRAYCNLSDDSSKLLFICLIAYRMAGHLSFKIPAEFLRRTEELAAYRNAEKSVESSLPVTGMFGKLRHFDFEFEGKRYVVDCLGLEYCLHRHQYFYDQDGIRIAPEQGDTVIDGGACTGDTAIVFSNAVGAEGKVYSFDPVQEHIDILTYNANQFPYHNVEIMPYGLSNREVKAAPIITNYYAPGFSSATPNIPLTSLDILVRQGTIGKIDFIKLDVEGAELDTLKGAEDSIRKFRPKMAVSLYHKPNDIFEIINYIKTNFDFYSLHLGHYTIHSEETVLYCRPIPV
ncbi:FkbM family methyltransferase [Gluconacetobacter diazotrophicus]|uniref:FkbM family methyltransferase n=1 Tax=Gluconacetobacter diazotrophicus TaxID=33996 RepID=UPI001198FD5D|nr:FkbM family methyltransferase [Gluconacetobacter diazotrophicus]TWB07753.1 FkbM family methyltransferase [Gluconacetobacter diazotrophicus]